MAAKNSALPTQEYKNETVILLSILQCYCFYCISDQYICMPLAFNVYIFSVSLLEFILGLPFLQRTWHAAFDQNMLPFDSIIKFPDFVMCAVG